MQKVVPRMPSDGISLVHSAVQGHFFGVADQAANAEAKTEQKCCVASICIEGNSLLLLLSVLPSHT